MSVDFVMTRTSWMRLMPMVSQPVDIAGRNRGQGLIYGPRSVRKIDRSVLGGPKVLRASDRSCDVSMFGCRSIPRLDSPPAVPSGLQRV
jgi:hypothetical protein